jgi:transcriptional regulator with XRE-family HTH domain
MLAEVASIQQSLDSRRRRLGMSFDALSARSGASTPTLKRMLGGDLGSVSLGTVAAVARALGAPIGGTPEDPDDMVRRRARELAERTARLVQGTSALEDQAVDAATFDALVERTYHQLMSGHRRRLWRQ